MTATSWNFCGNVHAAETLRRAVGQGSVRHAYLISGIRGVGKSTLARLFAAGLICQQGSDGIPCGSCSDCTANGRGVHPDVLLFSLESQEALSTDRTAKGTTLAIETARAITSQAPIRPFAGRWKVMIVQDAETMQTAAQEALLKTIEEPPRFLVLILLATDVESLIPTIQSRCESIELLPVLAKTIESWLVDSGSDPALAARVAAVSAGAPGWAFEATRDGALYHEHEESVARAAGWIDGTEFERIVVAFQASETYARRKDEVFDLLQDSEALWRDAFLVRSGNSDRIVHRTQSEFAMRLGESIELSLLLSALRSVRTCISDLQSNVRPRLALESMVLKWPTLQSPSNR